ncbi:hypothetical protein ACO0RG_000622 [Hanseniaspora osmophila]|uniref:Uncharacterized protein n=1 Tax=Hanseniaspora osmophila TaxID=56408 RepID=A0A1E5R231_9ASCO|nr:hypothetical protein AWRI3579_g4148 [Hanseniaspora osmophila]
MELLINEILKDDSIISSLNKDEQENTIDQDTRLQEDDEPHTLYELLDTTENARKTFYKVNSNLRGKNLSSHDRDVAERNFEKIITSVVQKWAEQEAGLGSSSTHVSQELVSPRSLYAGETTRSSVSNGTKWNNQGSNILFSWSSDNDTLKTQWGKEKSLKKDGDEVQKSKPSTAENAIERQPLNEAHITNEKLLSMASKHLLTLTMLDVGRKGSLAKSHSTTNADTKGSRHTSFDSLDADSKKDSTLSDFKMDPLLEFRPTIIKTKPDEDSEKKSSKHKSKSKSLASWIWGGSASNDTTHKSKTIRVESHDGGKTGKLSSKSQKNTNIKPSSDQAFDDSSLDVHLMDMSTISYKLAGNKKTNDKDNTIIQSIRNASLDKASVSPFDSQTFHNKKTPEEDPFPQTPILAYKKDDHSEPAQIDDVSLSTKPEQIDNEFAEFETASRSSEKQDFSGDLLGSSFQPLQPKKKVDE